MHQQIVTKTFDSVARWKEVTYCIMYRRYYIYTYVLYLIIESEQHNSLSHNSHNRLTNRANVTQKSLFVHSRDLHTYTYIHTYYKCPLYYKARTQLIPDSPSTYRQYKSIEYVKAGKQTTTSPLHMYVMLGSTDLFVPHAFEGARM